MNKKLDRRFFERKTLQVARDLLGKVIVRQMGSQKIKGRILETEAYIGEEDQACHARFGKTKRNAVMYGLAGHAYIYLCYGLHELLNIVTERENLPAAVLIRKIEPLSSPSPNLKTYGPGNLTKYLKITRALNGEDVVKSKQLWVENDGYVAKTVKRAERIGVPYAGEHAKRRWRFVLVK